MPECHLFHAALYLTDEFLATVFLVIHIKDLILILVEEKILLGGIVRPDVFDTFIDITFVFYLLHLPIVVGTTAWYDRLDEVSERCLREKQSLFYAPNFSIGMNMVFMMNKQLARFAEQYGYSMTVAETHHIHKLDKPSGTAAKLANDIIAESSRYQRWEIEEPKDRHCEGGTTDALPIEVTREGEVFGIHSVTAQSSADRITLTHEAFSREGLAKGALAAAQFLVDKTGVFTMESLFC